MSLQFGLLGEKLGHSLSPTIHNLIFQRFNLHAAYQLYEVQKDNLESAMASFRSLGIRGLNVTIPYKTDVMKYLSSVSKEALDIGSINTIIFNDESLSGYNTDYHGFGDMLRRFDIGLNNKRAVVLGTGGSSKAITQYLLDKGIKDICLVSRSTSKALEVKLADNCRLIDYAQLRQLPHMDMIINCTPCGMFPNTDESPITADQLDKFNTAIDLIYNPAETLFLKYAKQAGCTALNGLYMLVSQAAASEKLWNDIEISPDDVDWIYNSMLTPSSASKFGK